MFEEEFANLIVVKGLEQLHDGADGLKGLVIEAMYIGFDEVLQMAQLFLVFGVAALLLLYPSSGFGA